jgi:hypothetical protein
MTRTDMTRTSFATLFAITIAVASLSGCSRVQQLRTGDEPPIRVRNGSLEIELLQATKVFEEEPGSAEPGKIWQIKDSERERNRFLVVIASSNQQCLGVVGSGNKVDIVYSDGQALDIQAIGSGGNPRTKIKARGDALRNPTGQLLTHAGASGGYISEVRVSGGGQPTTCTFTSRDPTLQIFLLD